MEGNRTIIKNMLKSNLTEEQIVMYTGLTGNEVKEIIKLINKE